MPVCTYNCLHEKEQRVHSALFCPIFLYHLHPHIIYICVSISSVCVALFCFSFSLLLSRFPSALRLIGYSWETVVKGRERQTLKAGLGRRRLTLWLKFASKATVVRVSIIYKPLTLMQNNETKWQSSESLTCSAKACSKMKEETRNDK